MGIERGSHNGVGRVSVLNNWATVALCTIQVLSVQPKSKCATSQKFAGFHYKKFEHLLWQFSSVDNSVRSFCDKSYAQLTVQHQWLFIISFKIYFSMYHIGGGVHLPGGLSVWLARWCGICSRTTWETPAVGRDTFSKHLKTFLFVMYWYIQRIRGFTIMCSINVHFTYLLSRTLCTNTHTYRFNGLFPCELANMMIQVSAVWTV